MCAAIVLQNTPLNDYRIPTESHCVTSSTSPKEPSHSHNHITDNICSNSPRSALLANCTTGGYARSLIRQQVQPSIKCCRFSSIKSSWVHTINGKTTKNWGTVLSIDGLGRSSSIDHPLGGWRNSCLDLAVLQLLGVSSLRKKCVSPKDYAKVNRKATVCLFIMLKSVF